MSKLNALKEKVAGVKSQLAEKVDKIAFIKSWREKRAAAANAPEKPANPLSLVSIYKTGGFLSKLQVVLICVLVLTALVSAGILAKKLAGKFSSSNEHDQIKQDYSHGLAEVKRKSLEKAEMISLGQFTTNAYVGADDPRLMSIDLWIRVSSPDVAALVENKSIVFQEKTMDALNALFVGKVNLLTEEGKTQAKEKIKETVAEALPHGQRVEEVFIQNLVFQ